MTGNSRYLGPEAPPPVLRLSRNGTGIAKSSEFTRAAAILHATDVTVDIKGSHDIGNSRIEVTGGVAFMSAHSKLGKIFEKEYNGRQASEGEGNDNLPPPPPPPPSSKYFSDKSLGYRSNDENAKSTTKSSAGLVFSKISSVSVEGSSFSHGNAFQTQIAAPPPLNGMFVNPPTRHQKLIKTKLADLPEDIQQQEPQIRGGVAVYRVSSALQIAHFGNFVEINAADYIEMLKQKVDELELRIRLMTTEIQSYRKLTNTSSGKLRTSLRLRAFVGKRPKRSDFTKEKLPQNSVPKRTATLSRERSSLSLGHHENQSEEKTADSSNNSEITHAQGITGSVSQRVRFPNGFGGPHGLNADRLVASSLSHCSLDQSRSGNVSAEKAKTGKGCERKSEIPVTLQSIVREPSCSDSGKLQGGMQHLSNISRSEHQDRRTILTLGLQARKTRKTDTVGRTRSFSGFLGGSLRKEFQNANDEGKTTRTSSLHTKSDIAASSFSQSGRKRADLRKPKSIRRLFKIN